MENNNPPVQEGSLRTVKAIFFAMMLVLIGGMTFLFVTIYKHNQSKTELLKCAESPLHLPISNKVIAIAQDGNTLTLLVNKGEGQQEIILTDGCKGNIIRRIVLRE